MWLFGTHAFVHCLLVLLLWISKWNCLQRLQIFTTLFNKMLLSMKLLVCFHLNIRLNKAAYMGLSQYDDILGLCAACWARFMCHQKLWPTSVSRPFSFLNSFLGLVGAKYYQKITIHISIELFFKMLFFLIFFLSLAFLLTFVWFGCYCSLWLCFRPGN